MMLVTFVTGSLRYRTWHGALIAMEDSWQTPPATSLTSSPYRALVVDDEPSLIRVVAGYLEHEGFVVTTAADGEQALAAARRDPPDVVVLDVMLPGIDGIEVCRQLRTFTDAYVIMLTARSEEVDTLIGLSVGADDYMTNTVLPARADGSDPQPASPAAHHGPDQKRCTGAHAGRSEPGPTVPTGSPRSDPGGADPNRVRPAGRPDRTTRAGLHPQPARQASVGPGVGW